MCQGAEVNTRAKGCACQFLLRTRLERGFWRFMMDGKRICGSNDAIYLLELPKISLKVSLAFPPASTHTYGKFRTLYSHKNNYSFGCHPSHYHCCHGFSAQWRGLDSVLSSLPSVWLRHSLLIVHPLIHPYALFYHTFTIIIYTHPLGWQLLCMPLWHKVYVLLMSFQRHFSYTFYKARVYKAL